MKKKVTLVLAIVMVLGSIRAMASDNSETLQAKANMKIAAIQIDDMKLMIEDIIEMQERADVLFGEDEKPRVGQLYKLAAEADVIFMNVVSSTSAEDIHTSWMAVKSLKKTACDLVPGYTGCN